MGATEPADRRADVASNRRARIIEGGEQRREADRLLQSTQLVGGPHPGSSVRRSHALYTYQRQVIPGRIEYRLEHMPQASHHLAGVSLTGASEKELRGGAQLARGADVAERDE